MAPNEFRRDTDKQISAINTHIKYIREDIAKITAVLPEVVKDNEKNKESIKNLWWVVGTGIVVGVPALLSYSIYVHTLIQSILSKTGG